MIHLLLALAAPATPGAPTQGLNDILLPIGLTVVVIYFLMLRPQQQRAQQHKKLLEGLKKGDYVLTNAGFFGRVVDVDKKVATVEVAPNVRIKILKEAIDRLDRPDAEEAIKPT